MTHAATSHEIEGVQQVGRREQREDDHTGGQVALPLEAVNPLGQQAIKHHQCAVHGLILQLQGLGGAFPVGLRITLGRIGAEGLGHEFAIAVGRLESVVHGQLRLEPRVGLDGLRRGGANALNAQPDLGGPFEDLVALVGRDAAGGQNAPARAAQPARALEEYRRLGHRQIHHIEGVRIGVEHQVRGDGQMLHVLQQLLDQRRVVLEVVRWIGALPAGSQCIDCTGEVCGLLGRVQLASSARLGSKHRLERGIHPRTRILDPILQTAITIQKCGAQGAMVMQGIHELEGRADHLHAQTLLAAELDLRVHAAEEQHGQHEHRNKEGDRHDHGLRHELHRPHDAHTRRHHAVVGKEAALRAGGLTGGASGLARVGDGGAGDLHGHSVRKKAPSERHAPRGETTDVPQVLRVWATCKPSKSATTTF
jgi:hypothetical protein